MKIYILKTNKKISPFNENASDLTVANIKIVEHQKQCFEDLGYEYEYLESANQINKSDEYVLLNDNVFFTETLLIDFIDKSKILNKNTVCSLKKGNFTEKTIITAQDAVDAGNFVRYSLWYYCIDNSDIEPIILDLDNSTQVLNFPDHMCKGGIYLAPFNTRMIVQIDHWSNLWATNLIYILSHLKGIEENNKFELFVKAILNATFNKWKLLSKVNKIGKNCDIHHTAYVEGSIIGDGVTIGANSVVRHAIVGDGAYVGNSVTIDASVIGSKSIILNGHIFQTVILAESFSVTHFISASLVGNRNFIGSGAVLTDFRFDHKNISVMKDGKAVDSGSTFLGCCLGNDVYMGGGCIVAPGREIPNNTKVSLDKGKIITKIPEEGFRITS